MQNSVYDSGHISKRQSVIIKDGLHLVLVWVLVGSVPWDKIHVQVLLLWQVKETPSGEQGSGTGGEGSQ